MKEIDVESIFEEIKRSLSDFAPTPDSVESLMYSNSSSKYSIDRNELPVPELIKYLLGGILKCKFYGPGEKVRWEVLFYYKNQACSFALEKFGLRLYLNEDIQKHKDEHIIKKQIIGKINRVIKRTESQLFTPFAKEQIKENNVTIANNYHRLENRYLFFQEKVEEELKPKPKSESSDIGMLSNILNGLVQSQREVLYFTLAMLDAYFSYLEHLLVLLYPFSNNQSDKCNLVDFMSAAWGQKFKYLFDINDPKISKIYSSLKNIKENYRNYYAHGGFEKRGASLYFHFPGLGALPALLSNVKDKPQFKFYPVEEAEYKEISKVINEFNNWVRSEESKMDLPVKYIESGLDISCDSNGLEEIRKHMNSVESLNELIEDHSHISDIHDNMDY